MSVTSKRVEQIDVDVRLKTNSKSTEEQVFENNLARAVRVAISNMLSDAIVSDDVESIDINYHLEDN